jgi:putative heme iron utilization protein
MTNLNAEACASMIEHMNGDHADSVVAYARHYGKAAAAESAMIVGLDSLGMDIEAVSNGVSSRLRVAFDHELVDALDGRKTLVAMAMEARTAS